MGKIEMYNHNDVHVRGCVSIRRSKKGYSGTCSHKCEAAEAQGFEDPEFKLFHLNSGCRACASQRVPYYHFGTRYFCTTRIILDMGNPSNNRILMLN